MLIQDEDSSESEILVSEVMEIMEMIKTVKNKILEAKNGKNKNPSNTNVEKLESLLNILRSEIGKRGILIAEKHGIHFKHPATSVLLNGKSRSVSEPDFVLSDLTRLEEELNRAYRVAQETLSNLSKVVWG